MPLVTKKTGISRLNPTISTLCMISAAWSGEMAENAALRSRPAVNAPRATSSSSTAVSSMSVISTHTVPRRVVCMVEFEAALKARPRGGSGGRTGREGRR